MAEYLVELYVSQADADAVAAGARRARIAADELAREGLDVSYERSIFVPEDETCFYVFEAGSADGVRHALARAGLRCERVAEAVTESKAERR